MVRGILRDITVRCAAERQFQELKECLEQRVQERTAALALSEARLEEAQRVAGVGHWELDLLTGELNWSDELYHLAGFDPETVIPNYELFLRFVHPDDRLIVADGYKNSLGSRESL